jgi:hypothetical protein
MRPYRESSLLARARRTESFHRYRDFQTINLNRTVERTILKNGNWCPIQAEVKGATEECNVSESKSSGTEIKTLKELDNGLEVHKIAEVFQNPRKGHQKMEIKER